MQHFSILGGAFVGRSSLLLVWDALRKIRVTVL